MLKNEQEISIRNYGSSNLFNSSSPNYINIASVLPPSVPSSYGTAQATSIAIHQSYVFVAYNTEGNEVYGALDIIDISDPYLPKIIYTYLSEDFEFSDIKIKNNTLYLAGSKRDLGAALLVFDISSISNPQFISSVKMSGYYATSLDLNKNILSVSTGSSGGIYKFDVSEAQIPILKKSYNYDNALFVKSTLLYDLIL